jgi:hypothetical protein
MRTWHTALTCMLSYTLLTLAPLKLNIAVVQHTTHHCPDVHSTRSPVSSSVHATCSPASRFICSCNVVKPKSPKPLIE